MINFPIVCSFFSRRFALLFHAMAHSFFLAANAFFRFPNLNSNFRVRRAQMLLWFLRQKFNLFLSIFEFFLKTKWVLDSFSNLNVWVKDRRWLRHGFPPKLSTRPPSITVHPTMKICNLHRYRYRYRYRHWHRHRWTSCSVDLLNSSAFIDYWWNKWLRSLYSLASVVLRKGCVVTPLSPISITIQNSTTLSINNEPSSA